MNCTFDRMLQIVQYLARQMASIEGGFRPALSFPVLPNISESILPNVVAVVPMGGTSDLLSSDLLMGFRPLPPSGLTFPARLVQQSSPSRTQRKGALYPTPFHHHCDRRPISILPSLCNKQNQKTNEILTVYIYIYIYIYVCVCVYIYYCIYIVLYFIIYKNVASSFDL